MKKRFSAFLLAALMVAALLPAVSMAAETNAAKIGDTEYTTLKAALTAATSGDTVTLLKDLKDTGKLTLKAGVTLDGDGFEISGNSCLINQLYTAGTFTIKNCVFREIANGKGTLSAVYIERYVEGSDFIIEGNTFDGVEWDALAITLHGYGDATSVTDAASVTIKNNIFKDSDQTTSTKRYIHYQPIYSGNPSLPFDLTLTGNEIHDDGVETAVGLWYLDAAAKVEISDNKITNMDKVVVILVDEEGGYTDGAAAVEQLFPAPAYAGPVMNWVKVNAADNGVVKSGPLAASAGATITLYPKAAEGYVLDAVSVLDAEGNAVALDGLKFAIPAGGVTVNATFKLAE